MDLFPRMSKNKQPIYFFRQFGLDKIRIFAENQINNIIHKMKSTLKVALRSFMFVMAVMVGATVCRAADTEITEEFANEGIEKAEAAMANIVKNLNEITTMEQMAGLERAFNTIEFRNVRKKYGKVQLTDEYRARLVESNKAVAKALMDLMDRVSAPLELRDLLKNEVSEEKIV